VSYLDKFAIFVCVLGVLPSVLASIMTIRLVKSGESFVSTVTIASLVAIVIQAFYAVLLTILTDLPRVG
jgi:hypothetical protein